MRDIFIIFIALLNFLLFLGKFLVGIFSHSVGLISDSVNSFTDTINTLVVLWATKIARKEADDSHPAGHGRAQPLAAFFVAIMTGVLAIEIIKESILTLFEPKTLEYEVQALGILLLTILTKGTMSFFEYRKGKKENNSALLAMSVESRGDMLISLGAIFGILASIHFGWTWADPIAGILIGLYVLYTGYEIANENIHFLMGGAASKEDIVNIQKTLRNIPEIRGYHDLYTQHLGENIQVTVHCEVEGDFTIQEWHDLEAKISESLEHIERVDRAFVHLDPPGRHHD